MSLVTWMGDKILSNGLICREPVQYSSKQGNSLKGIDKKTVRREGIVPTKRVFTHIFFPVKHFL